ncbi:MAG: ankyrin repeat domain-containing protein, partial [Verrucomicrobia bacterium]|nr:ankyrin repeat domain-containing protein [Verrucomicrobiota bacterium]
KSGSLEMTKKFLCLGYDINAGCQEEYYSPLHLAIFYGHSDIAHYLIDEGASIHYSSTNLLVSCLEVGNIELFELLISKGVSEESLISPDNRNYVVQLLLQIPHQLRDDRYVNEKKVKMLKWMINKKKINQLSSQEIINNINLIFPELVEYFLDKKLLDPNCKTGNGLPLLIEAARASANSKLEFVSALLLKGARVNSVDNQNRNLLFYLVGGIYWTTSPSEFIKRKSLIEFAVQCGAEINAKDKNGKTVLSTVTNPAIREFLMSIGAK